MSETESHPSVVPSPDSPRQSSLPPRRRYRFSRPIRAARKATPPAAIRKATTASALGNATEWYDYGVYAVTTGYIAQHFFPGEAAVLLTLGTFALSFVIRPLGGFFWGPLGDRIGRKGVLALTILLMSAATVGIGLLPTAEQVGWLAPALLILMRMVQGFSTGGEYGGAATYMAEYAPDSRRGFFGSFLEFGTMGGYALGTLVVLSLEAVLTPEQMMDWGWRVPYLLAAPLGLIGYYLRSKLSDTPVYSELSESAGESAASEAGEGARPDSGDNSDGTDEWKSLTFRDKLRRGWRPMLVMGGLVTAVNIVNYTLLTYMPTYLEQRIGLPASTGLVVILIGELAMMAFMPLGGALSDRFGRKVGWYVSLMGLLVLAIPMFALIGTGFVLAILGFAVLSLLFIPQLSTISATFPAIFPTHVRFGAFAITYNVATALFGGTAAVVNETGVRLTGDLQFPAYYMMAACVIGLVSVWFLRETSGASLRGTEVPGAVGSAVVPHSPAHRALEKRRQPEQRSMTEDEMLTQAAEARDAASDHS